MKRILIVDDNFVNCEVLGLLLEDDGHKVRLLELPENIDAEIADFLPDMILMDVMMGRFNGMDICRRLKSCPEFRAKIVLVTASNAFLNIDRNVTLADGHISKPYDIEHVSALVFKLLDN